MNFSCNYQFPPFVLGGFSVIENIGSVFVSWNYRKWQEPDLFLHLNPNRICVMLSGNYLRSGFSAVFPQWADKNAYKETLLKLADLFKNNFETFTNYKIGKDNRLTEEILAAGPIFWSESRRWRKQKKKACVGCVSSTGNNRAGSLTS